MDGRSEENLNSIIKKYLKKNDCTINGRSEDVWSIKKSPLGGFGIFAAQDIQAGELIFLDHPVLLGPRNVTDFPVQCSTCYRKINIEKCGNCGLLVCDQCSNSEKHVKECHLLGRLKNGHDFPENIELLTKCLTPLRALILDKEDLEVVTKLKSHRGRFLYIYRNIPIEEVSHFDPDEISKNGFQIWNQRTKLRSQHGREVQILTEDLKLQLSSEEKDFLYFVCTVLDANAFEVLTDGESSQISVRGSLANHRCFPNVFHVFDEKHRMVARASVFIPKNTEIFHSYTRLLWGTITRNYHLKKTKHFVCKCERCNDPSEFGTFLSAVKCKKCSGSLLPINPLQKSNWQCATCTSVETLNEVARILFLVGSVLKGFDNGDFKLMYSFLIKQLTTLMPDCNQVAVELKYKIIWILGHRQGFLYSEISLDLVLLKKQFCKDILDIIEKLRLGKCKIRGLLYYELYLCNEEIKQRENNTNNEALEEEINSYLLEAIDILKYDVGAPQVLKEKIAQGK